MQIDPNLSPGDFASLPSGTSLYLVVRTCGTLLETALDTILMLQTPNPYRHGLAADVVRGACICTCCDAVLSCFWGGTQWLRGFGALEKHTRLEVGELHM